MLRFLAWILQPLNRATARRWLDVFLLGLVGAGVCLAGWPVLQKVSYGSVWLVDFISAQATDHLGREGLIFGTWPFGFLLCMGVLVLLTSLMLAVLIRLGALRWSHATSLLLYPPVWIAALWPVAVYAFLTGPEVIDKAVFIQCGVLLVVSGLLTLVVTSSLTGERSRLSNRPDAADDPEHLPTAEETLEGFAKDPPGRLIPWLMTDEPVREPGQDLFESYVLAEYIAELITQHQLGRIGLIGRWGSGKTTVLNLVDFLLHRSKTFRHKYRQRWLSASQGLSWRQRQRPPRMLSCWVRAWGFAKEPAATVVLREAVAEISKRIDCLSIRGLPDNYIAAMKGTTPAWVHGPLALTSADSPSQQLRRLDRLLEAINARLIIFIEDLDRNIGMRHVAFVHNVKNEGKDGGLNVHCDLTETPDSRLFLDIESLLDRMADLQRMSFVLTLSRSAP